MYVISTAKRPVPLEYFLFANKELHKVVDAKRDFQDDGYRRAYEVFHKPAKPGAAKGGASSSGGATSSGSFQRRGAPSEAADRTHWTSLVTFLREKQMTPVVCFTLSKKRCESNATGLSGMDLTTSSEKNEIKVFYEASVQRLKGADVAYSS